MYLCYFVPLFLCSFVPLYLFVSLFLCTLYLCTLYLCTFVPLYLCTFVPLYLCTFDVPLCLCIFSAPLYLCTFVPFSLNTNVPLYHCTLFSCACTFVPFLRSTLYLTLSLLYLCANSLLYLPTHHSYIREQPVLIMASQNGPWTNFVSSLRMSKENGGWPSVFSSKNKHRRSDRNVWKWPTPRYSIDMVRRRQDTKKLANSVYMRPGRCIPILFSLFCL